ncbi:uncharacterized protein PV06_06213 [Exophiala oligosperma]|uniref:SET domain-containing protein n=2 Tax=Chaetothyriales TaxID=34395 RepID=A0A0D2DJS8_9EURO|nr:uncharacterized protein PV06_06213 [Exophiala oligosperma]KAJ9633486.1 hypothetical protein H2204_006868 [Knufia peltigerae]KIW42690.1 hypothetical protein PV06_06213 [Exophiala oligosperma]
MMSGFYRKSTATRPGSTEQENSTSRQHPGIFSRLPVSSLHHGRNATPRDGNQDDPIVLSDSDDEESSQQAGLVDLTSNTERDHSFNPWRRANDKPQNSSSSLSHFQPPFATRHSLHTRDSRQTVLPKSPTVAQSYTGTTRVVSRPTSSAGGQINSPGRRDVLNSPARTPQTQARGGVDVRTTMAEGVVSGRTALQAFSATPTYPDLTQQGSLEEIGRVPIRSTATNPPRTVRAALVDSVSQLLQEQQKRSNPNLFSKNVYRSSRSNLSETINDTSIRAKTHVEPPARDSRSAKPDLPRTPTDNNTSPSTVAVGSSIRPSTHHGHYVDGARSAPTTCVNCHQANHPCDGMTPCRPCEESGKTCSYTTTEASTLPLGDSEHDGLSNTGEHLDSTPRRTTTDQVNRPTEISLERAVEEATPSIQRPTRALEDRRARVDATTNIMSGEAIGLDSRPGQEETTPLHHMPHQPADNQHIQKKVMTAALIEDDSFASDDSNATHSSARIEPRSETIKSIIENLRKDLHACRERSVQAELRQAAVDMRNHSGPVIDVNAADPFAALTEKRRSEYAAESTSLARPQNKKLQLIPASEVSFWTGGTTLPKYKAIGRVSSSFLSPGFWTAKYHPYDAEDEIQDPDKTKKYEERSLRLHINFESLVAQRNCQELVWLWKPWAEDLFSILKIQYTDVLYFFMAVHFDAERHMETGDVPKLKKEQNSKCRTCGLDPDRGWTHFKETFDSLPKPDDETLALAGTAAYAFHEATEVSLSHIALGGLIQPRYEDPSAKRDKDLGFCVICFRHQCPDHGSYEEPAEDVSGARDPDEDIVPAENKTAFINDEEQSHNIRKFMSLPMRERNGPDSHTCGLFCVDHSRTLRQVLGRQADGTAGGDFRPVTQRRHILDDGELCGSACFWDTANRRNIKIAELKLQPFQIHSQKLVVDKALQFYLNNKRGPCLIAQIVKDVSCMMIFEYLVWYIASQAHPSIDGETVSDSSTTQRISHAPKKKKKKKKKAPPNIDTSGSAQLDARKVFMRCSHEGPCYNNSACACSKSKIHCERFCGCDESCKRRFRGCTCTMRGNKNCYKDTRCECWASNRECDPFLCGKCGVLEVLDSNNKYNDEIRKGRCRNNRIQLALPAPTTKAPSQVQGYGLYSRAAIPAGEFIGEYTGEIINIGEGDRRGAMYSVLRQEYLFKINLTQEIDASNYGNKMRFMNNSQLDKHINVEPKMLWCNGVVRLGLFARRPIEPGEELLYNYNYPESVTKHFWEPGQRPANPRRAIPLASERIVRTTEAKTITVEQLNHRSSAERSQSPLLSRHPKRKRPVEDSPRNSTKSVGAGTSSSDDTREVSEILETDDSEYSNYVASGQVSDGGEEVEEPSDEALESDPNQNLPTRRKGSRTSRPTSLTRRTSSKTRNTRHAAETDSDRSRSRQGSRTSETSSRRLGASGSVQMVKRRRKIGPHDRRFGGRSQQLAWQTRRAKESLEQGATSNDDDV